MCNRSRDIEDLRDREVRRLQNCYGILVAGYSSWALTELRWVSEALEDLILAAGWPGSRNQHHLRVRRLLGAVGRKTIKLSKVIESDKCPGCDGFYRPDISPFSPYVAEITLTASAIRGGRMGIKGTFIHEFAHVWDLRSTKHLRTLSLRMLFRTGSSYAPGWPPKYRPGGKAARSYLGGAWYEAPFEDFAHAVAAFVYPDRTELDGVTPYYDRMDQARKAFVRRALHSCLP